MDKKPEFVARLGELLKDYSREPVEKMVYECDIMGEAVYIYFENGYQKRVNVNCDSCIAIMADVYKALI